VSRKISLPNFNKFSATIKHLQKV